MARKRLTQAFPFLLPVRTAQRRICFYAAMRFDGRRYARTLRASRLPYALFETDCALYNHSTGFDMAYQENKVFNLRLAARTLDGLVIWPGETFSFWRLVRHADKRTPYREGLTVKDGRLTTAYGGGMCQMSNLLFWMFLHTPLTLVERGGHDVKEFPEPNSDEIKGVDATISEGWIDLKVRNDTDCAYQIAVRFDARRIYGTVFAQERPAVLHKIVNGEVRYIRAHDGIHEHAVVERLEVDARTGAPLGKKRLYVNRCKIGYPLPDGTAIEPGETARPTPPPMTGAAKRMG